MTLITVALHVYMYAFGICRAVRVGGADEGLCVTQDESTHCFATTQERYILYIYVTNLMSPTRFSRCMHAYVKQLAGGGGKVRITCYCDITHAM